MLFNEEENTEIVADTNVHVDSADLGLDAAGDAPGAGNYTENVELDYDALNSQTDTEDEYHEDVELDYDALGDNNTSEAVELDFDVLDDQTDTEDEYHEDVAPISFSESNVRIFQRANGNLITESDLSAVMQYYNYEISESQALEMIANVHNISEDSIMVMMNEASSVVDKGVKKVKSAKSAIDMQIAALLKQKKSKTPEQWKKSGMDEKLKKLRAKKALQA